MVMSLNADRPHVRGSKARFWDEPEPVEPVRQYATRWGAMRGVCRDDSLEDFEKLAMLITIQAAWDLTDPRCDDEDYSSAVHFFTSQPSLFTLVEGALGLEDTGDLCRELINGREVIPLQALLL